MAALSPQKQVFGHRLLVPMLRFAQRRALIGRATLSCGHVARFAPAGMPAGSTMLSLRAQSTSSGDKGEITEAVAAWRKAPTAPLRFPVGAPVKCLVAGGAWATGRVVKHDHREADGAIQPYQIMIDAEHARGEQNAVWAPADIDECIRAALRFGVGDTVECCVNPDLGLWVGGKVVAQFFRESKWPTGKYAPYQVLIDEFFDETTGKTLTGALIWAPEDTDACIRKQGKAKPLPLPTDVPAGG